MQQPSFKPRKILLEKILKAKLEKILKVKFMVKETWLVTTIIKCLLSLKHVACFHRRLL